MPVLRIALVSIFAAVAGCPLGTLILFGTVERASLIPLTFTLIGSLLLLAPSYAALKEQGMPLGGRYALLCGIGLVGGFLILGLISRGELWFAAMGSFFGLTTALCWIALHALTRPRTRAASGGTGA
jgi:hypothetical protein